MEGRNADSYLRFMIFVEDINANAGGIPAKDSPKDTAYFDSRGIAYMFVELGSELITNI